MRAPHAAATPQGVNLRTLYRAPPPSPHSPYPRILTVAERASRPSTAFGEAQIMPRPRLLPPPRPQVRQEMMMSNSETMPLTMAMMTAPMALTMAIRQLPIVRQMPSSCGAGGGSATCL